MILERYIMREILVSIMGILLVLTLIILGQQLMLVLEDALRGAIKGATVLEMLGMRMISGLHLIIPFAFFLSTLLALGRLYKDSEVASMMACGSGYLPMYRATILLAIAGALVVFLLSGFLAPWSQGRIQQLNFEARQQTDISKYRPGVFESSGDGRNVLYFSELDKKANLMQGIFLRLQTKGGNGEEVIMAESGSQKFDQASAERILHLYNGVRYQGRIGSPQYSVMQFGHYQIRLPDVDLELINSATRAQSLGKLRSSSSPAMLAEYHWRLSAPISLFILALLAVPLSHANPRQGKYAKLFTAIMLFAVYAALLGLSKAWMEQGKYPVALGFWWAHGIMLLVLAYWVIRRNGWGWQDRYKRLLARMRYGNANP